MFTGIIESTGIVKEIRTEGTNLHFTMASVISDQLKIDQSISHDGVCLTVVKRGPGTHTVTAVAETLKRSSLGSWETGQKVNLERCLRVGDRLDGHMVQGHVDATATCVDVSSSDGSWNFTFQYPVEFEDLIVPKGSIAVNGVSLTVVNPAPGSFSVAIIPYTFEHTNFQSLKAGDIVNIEFDILGKYILQHAKKMALPSKG
jgi:riboflavin synthase